MSIPSSRGGSVERLTKYMVPANPADNGLLPPLFQNIRRFPLHQQFLAQAFPDLFPALTQELYDQLVNHRATRQYFVGDVFRLRTEAGILYGFNALSDPRELLTVEEVRRILSAIRLLRYRACLTTMYACGLRLKEGTHLQVADIDSTRMFVHVRLGPR